MWKVIFYSLLSLLTVASLYLANRGVNEHAGWSIHILPHRLQQAWLDHVLKQSDAHTSEATFIIGTSHVQTGFDGCSHNALRTYFRPAADAQSHLRIAKTLMYAAALRHMQRANIVLEVTLVEQAALPKSGGIIRDALVDTNPLMRFLTLFGEGLQAREGECLTPERRINDVALLKQSQAKSKTVNPEHQQRLLDAYRQHIDALVAVCERTRPASITLVSLPIHPQLLQTPEVKQVFDKLEWHISRHLAQIKNHHNCNIRYMNLVSLGAEFPQENAWFDAGHFTPLVGERVLTEIRRYDAR